MADRFRILIAHRLPVVAAGLAAALGSHDRFEVTTQAQPDPSSPAAAAIEPGFHVLVTDHSGALGWMNNRRQHAAAPAATPVRVLLVDDSDGEADVRAALRAGVHGYLLTDCELGELVDSVGRLCQGGRYLCASVANRVAESLTHEALTQREGDVLALMVRGLSNKLIARELGIAVGTVKAHAKAVFSKLGVRSRSQAVALASARGLVTPARDLALA